MVNSWLAEQNKSATIVGINDINDPPNWVKHATDYHGDGVLVTSDEATKELYQKRTSWLNLLICEQREFRRLAS